MSELPVEKNDIKLTVAEYQDKLRGYLDALKLPSEKVLVDVEEREIVFAIAPRVVSKIDDDKKETSFYISKFIAACGAGLFDAALNYLWDETILCLRKKIINFDLDYFRSNLDEKTKKILKDENDLRNIDDNEIVIGCKSIGLISDVGFRHLDYIRSMRNWVSAAHPNQEVLTGLNLCNWLEICIREVIGKDPVGPAIANKQLLHNIRTKIFDMADVEPIKTALNDTPEEYVVAIANALFGMFCDPDVGVDVKSNIRLIAKCVWNLLPQQVKADFGMKHATWTVNGDLPKKELAHDFLELVDGLSFLSIDVKVAEFSDALDLLYRNHVGINNFYNEPPFARMISKYISETGDVPDAVRKKYVKVILLCCVGNGYGVSNAAEPVYLKLISLFTDKEIACFLHLFADAEFSSRLQFRDCQVHYRVIFDIIKKNTSKAGFLRIVDLIEKTNPSAWTHLGKTDEYNRLITLMNG